MMATDTKTKSFLWILFVFGFETTVSRAAWMSSTKVGLQRQKRSNCLLHVGHNQIPENNNDNGKPVDGKRRNLLSATTAISASTMLTTAATLTLPTKAAVASSTKSRTDGYAVQKSEAEWQSQLSDMQYYILRRGGTESPNYSILESEEGRPGIFVCAGCGTPLFDARDKFHSGTGWPSFARSLPGVEVEAVNPLQANLVGAELRCQTCGGHLGDVFNDGFLFVGTPAFVTGKRYCIDGAALIFQPAQEGQPNVMGDTPKPRELPSWFDPPKITPQS